MKHCNTCNTTKPSGDFPKRAASIDRLGSKCKSCASVYDKCRAQLPHRIAARRAYSKTTAGKTALSRSKAAWAHRNKDKRQAHILVGNAVRDGRLTKPKHCSSCGDGSRRIEGHHQDYSKPLDVIWLCCECHKTEHNQEAA